MKRIYFSILITFITIHLSVACTFVPNPFCQQFGNGNTILYGKTINTVANGVEFQIFDLLTGDETEEVITIYDQAPFDCNGTLYLNAELLLPLDLEVVVSLEKVDSLLNPWEEMGAYRVPEFYTDTRRLVVENDSVSGVITVPLSEQSMLLDEFIATVQNGDASCDLVLDVDDGYTDDIILSPNPASSFVILSSLNRNEISINQANIYSQVGSRHRVNVNSNNTIEISHLPNGWYIIEVLYTDGLRSRHKIVISR